MGAETAETHGSRIKVEAKGGQPNLGFWDNPQDWAAWKAKVTQAGTYNPASVTHADTSVGDIATFARGR